MADKKPKKGEPIIMHEYCSQRVVFDDVDAGFYARCPKCDEPVEKKTRLNFFLLRNLGKKCLLINNR
jgi:hypothetical protein